MSACFVDSPWYQHKTQLKWVYFYLNFYQSHATSRLHTHRDIQARILQWGCLRVHNKLLSRLTLSWFRSKRICFFTLAHILVSYYDFEHRCQKSLNVLLGKPNWFVYTFWLRLSTCCHSPILFFQTKNVAVTLLAWVAPQVVNFLFVFMWKIKYQFFTMICF